MSKYAVSPGWFAKSIYVGVKDRAGRAFADKSDLTDDVLLAVAEFVLRHFNGGMQMDFTFKGDEDAIRLNVKAQRISTPSADLASQGDGEAGPAHADPLRAPAPSPDGGAS